MLLNLKFSGSTTGFCVAQTKIPWFTHGDLCSSNLSTLVHPRGFVWVCCSILSTLVHPRGFVWVCCSKLSTLVHPRGFLLLNLKYPGSTTVFCVAKSKVPWFTHGDLCSSNLCSLVHPRGFVWVCCSIVGTLIHPRAFVLLNLKYPGSPTGICVPQT